MKNAHPVVVLLALVWLALEAAVTLARTLLVPALALLLTLASCRPAAASPATAPPPPPAVHPLALLADQLTTEHTRRQLQQLAGTQTNYSKQQLAAMLTAC